MSVEWREARVWYVILVYTEVEEEICQHCRCNVMEEK